MKTTQMAEEFDKHELETIQSALVLRGQKLYSKLMETKDTKDAASIFLLYHETKDLQRRIEKMLEVSA